MIQGHSSIQRNHPCEIEIGNDSADQQLLSPMTFSSITSRSSLFSSTQAGQEVASLVEQDDIQSFTQESINSVSQEMAELEIERSANDSLPQKKSTYEANESVGTSSRTQCTARQAQYRRKYDRVYLVKWEVAFQTATVVVSLYKKIQ